MRTVDHGILGIYLLRRTASAARIPIRYKAAFLWGNIEPDLNYATYLKGFLRERVLRGHHFKQSCRRIRTLLQKTEKDHLGILGYYRLGKLMHYLADAFTYPHNECFPGSIRQHVEYEHRMHRRFAALPEEIPEAGDRILSGVRPWELFRKRHEQYLERRKSEGDDIYYILRTTNEILHCLTVWKTGQMPVGTDMLLGHESGYKTGIRAYLDIPR